MIVIWFVNVAILRRTVEICQSCSISERSIDVNAVVSLVRTAHSNYHVMFSFYTYLVTDVIFSVLVRFRFSMKVDVFSAVVNF